MKVIIVVVLCLLLFCNTALADDWKVTWEPIKESIVDKEYGIAVQNLQDVKRNVNISSFFAETNFDISELSDVKFYEWKLIPYTYTENHYIYIDHNDYNEINGTWNNWTEQVYDYTETIELEKLDWKECKAKLFNEDGTTKEDNYGFINIPKFGSENDGDGTYNGIKFFKLTFKTPILDLDNGFGSDGKVAILLDGEEHHPYWNISWASRKEVILIGHENLTTSLNNSIEDGYIHDTTTYTRVNTTDYIWFGRNAAATAIYRGYIEWDISSLPSDAYVLDVKLKYQGQHNAADGHIHEMMGTQPSISDSRDIYNETGEGTIYADIADFPIVGTNQEIDLGSDAVSDLQLAITDGWFAIGLQGDGEVAGSAVEGIYSGEYASANPKPTLYINYTSESEGGITNYQILLNVTYEPGMQTDFDDLRFTNDTHEIDSWLESKVDSSYALVWVEFPTTPANGINQTYYMYYGNSDTFNNWNGDNTFLQWHGSATSDFFDSLVIQPSNIVYEAKIKRVGTANLIWGIADTAIAETNRIYVQSHTGGNLRYVGTSNSGSHSSVNEPPQFNDDTWVKAKITFDGSTLYGYIDGDEIGTGGVTTNLPTATLGLVFRQASGSGAQEYSFVRKYVINPPTYTFADIQYYTNNIHYNVTHPYNHTIDSSGAITVNRTIIAVDNINWGASALTNDCHLIVTEFNPSNTIIANFITYTAALDWLKVTNLSTTMLYSLQYINGTVIEQHKSDSVGKIIFSANLTPGSYQIVVVHPFLSGTYSFYNEMQTGLTDFKNGMGKYLVWGIMFCAAGLAFTLFAKIKQTLIGGK